MDEDEEKNKDDSAHDEDKQPRAFPCAGEIRAVGKCW